MTYDEIKQQHVQSRRNPRDEEHRLQSACVRWFRIKFPQMAHNLFAVPNGGRRDKATGGRLKAEGVLAGVADLILLKANANYHGLLIEMKTKSGRQSDSQKEWQRLIEQDGYKYTVCRSLDEFQMEVSLYLDDKNEFYLLK